MDAKDPNCLHPIPPRFIFTIFTHQDPCNTLPFLIEPLSSHKLLDGYSFHKQWPALFTKTTCQNIWLIINAKTVYSIHWQYCQFAVNSPYNTDIRRHSSKIEWTTTTQRLNLHSVCTIFNSNLFKANDGSSLALDKMFRVLK